MVDAKAHLPQPFKRSCDKATMVDAKAYLSKN